MQWIRLKFNFQIRLGLFLLIYGPWNNLFFLPFPTDSLHLLLLLFFCSFPFFSPFNFVLAHLYIACHVKNTAISASLDYAVKIVESKEEKSPTTRNSPRTRIEIVNRFFSLLYSQIRIVVGCAQYHTIVICEIAVVTDRFFHLFVSWLLLRNSKWIRGSDDNSGAEDCDNNRAHSFH